jgi:NADP-dependent 3-hydroxy acid dehydrogenase YdfG
MSEQHDKIMLITGASSGIGAETARQAAKEGYRLALAARSKDKLEALVDELGADRAFAVACDVTDFEDQKRMVQAVIDHYGRIDAVFANAGVGGRPAGFAGGSVDDWKEMVDVNILGAAYTLRASLDEVKKNKGHVLLTGSVAGRRTLAGSMYSATKWAVSAIGYGLRAELEGTGVRVTIIEPGMVDTPFFDKPVPDALEAADVARTVMFALSQPPHVDVHELMVLPTPPQDR